ncbi:MAG: DMT family transporter [Rhodospirillales bacterium]|jgi:O-acetylserine/cysteine efflux transporter|nr:DMT family transporter [Rhodospirillales bacterium]
MKPVHVFMVMAVQTLWGFGFTMAKVGLGPFPPMFLMGMRYGLAALVLVWFFRPPWGMMWKVCAAAVVSGTITYGLVFSGLRELYASTAILVVQLQVPFLALLGVVLLKEKLSLRGILGMAFAFGGVMLITGEPRIQGNLAPVFVVIAGGLFWALGQIMIRRLGSVGGMRLLAWIAVFASPQLFAASFALEEGQFAALGAAGWKEWGVILYLGLAMTALAYSLWYHVLARCEVNRIAPFLLLNPLVAVFSSILVLGEDLTPLIAAGGVIVIIGIGIMTINPGSWRRGPPPPAV